MNKHSKIILDSTFMIEYLFLIHLFAVSYHTLGLLLGNSQNLHCQTLKIRISILDNYYLNKHMHKKVSEVRCHLFQYIEWLDIFFSWMFVFQSVTCSLSVMGFGESIAELTGSDNPWVAKGVAIGLVVLLLGQYSVSYHQLNITWLKQLFGQVFKASTCQEEFQ